MHNESKKQAVRPTYSRLDRCVMVTYHMMGCSKLKGHNTNIVLQSQPANVIGGAKADKQIKLSI